ncbi:MAG: cytochrome P450 [Micropepsaceae bacterium]
MGALGASKQSAAPSYGADLYARAALLDPYPHYKRIRDTGPAVWLPKRKLWAIARFEDIRLALRAADKLVSGKGVAANKLVNDLKNEITLTADGADHQRRRMTLIKPLTPGPLKDLTQRIQTEADNLVARLKKGGTFDAMATFAAHLPVSIVADLVGLKPEGRENMLRWAANTFEALGPMNWRTLRALPALLDLQRYVKTLSRANVVPGGWADQIFAAADAGTLSRREAKSMIIDYVAPSLDTTILATGNMLQYLAQNPQVFAAIKNDNALIANAVYESVRLASPIRGFTRFAAEDFELGGVTIPKGARALVLFASGNRDERKYANPDAFDVTRNARDNVAWGHGPHVCVGMHLARLEMECLLRALVQQVDRIEVGEPVPFLNNVLQGFKSLPATFH